MRPRQNWQQMREGIIGLGADSSRRSFYPELLARVAQLEDAQEDLRRSEENLWTVFNSLHDAVIIHDSQGRVLEGNDAMLTMYGVTREDCRRFSILDYSALPESDAAVAARIQGYMDRLDRQDHVLFEWLACWPLNRETVFEVEVSLHKARWYDQEAIVAVVRDISERKRLQTLLHESQKLESLGQLAGGIAHDTNNMLGVILGYTEILLEQAPEASDQQRDLDHIRKAALHSAELIRQLLAFARRQECRPTLADLNVLVGHTQEMLKRLLPEPFSLCWKPAAELWKVKVDPTQIDQILTNLFLNARDALLPGSSIILETANIQVDEAYARFHPDALPGDYAVLVVSDTGTGMAPDIQARVFEPFFTTKEMGRGTGLGLATVYGIVRQNRGFITVYSSPGVGTTFRVHFPRQGEEPGPAEPDLAAEPLGGHETILLVEDEPALLALACRLLEGAGYRVLASADPVEALRLAAEHRDAIALLATDLIMPKLNGRELFERIRELRADIRALFLSGYPAGTLNLEALPQPHADFLQKPFTQSNLLRKVREILDSP